MRRSLTGPHHGKKSIQSIYPPARKIYRQYAQLFNTLKNYLSKLKSVK